jgi:hypothetical protein
MLKGVGWLELDPFPPVGRISDNVRMAERPIPVSRFARSLNSHRITARFNTNAKTKSGFMISTIFTLPSYSLLQSFSVKFSHLLALPRRRVMSINQCGVLLNFLAGILLAPHIFGEKKLKDWEDNFKAMIPRIERRFLKMTFISSDREDKPSYLFYFLGSVVGILFFLCGGGIMMSIPNRLLLSAPSVSSFFQNVIQILLLSLLLLLGGALLAGINRGLANQYGLEGVMTVLGVLFFVIGNLLQFLAG